MSILAHSISSYADDDSRDSVSLEELMRKAFPQTDSLGLTAS